MVSYVIKDEEGIRKYDTCLLLDREKFRFLNNKIKIRILELLRDKPMFISEIAEKLKINEQNVYYHLKDMREFLEVVEEKKVRGTTARKFRPKALNICLSLSNSFKQYKESTLPNSLGDFRFFNPFVQEGKLNCRIIVGSPEVHGPFKSRARDGHYAIDLGLFMGSFSKINQNFSVALDVDIKLEDVKENLIIVGGPVTNLVMGEINKHLVVNFKNSKQWGISGKKGMYTEDSCGLIARIQNPYNKDYWILVIAGIRFSGTKAAVIALTRFTRLILTRFTNQKEFYAIIQGFDLDGDGKIDSVELLE